MGLADDPCLPPPPPPPPAPLDADGDGKIDCFKDMVDSTRTTLSPLPDNKDLGENYGGDPDGVRPTHNGVDISAYHGDTVRAGQSGNVVQILTGQGNNYAGCSPPSVPCGGYHPNGNYVRVNHDDGTQGVYLHLHTVGVSVGDRVTAGDTLGTADNSGGSRGDHLHYTVWTSPGSGNAHNPETRYGGCP